MKQKLDNSNISKHLGKSSEYACNYDPTLLVREPRSSNRLHLGLEDDNLPFVGSDTWNGYEITGLTNNGLPVSFVGKFVYSSSSKYIVESKSTKLYFNSFSMTKLGNTIEEVKASIEQMAKKDLTELLETEVGVILATNKSMLAHDLTCDPKGEWHTDPNTVRNEYITLEDDYPIQDTIFDTYEESPELLEVLNNAGTVTFSVTGNGVIAGVIASATTATTQTAGDNSTKVATTAYVNTATSSISTRDVYISTINGSL